MSYWMHALGWAQVGAFFLLGTLFMLFGYPGAALITWAMCGAVGSACILAPVLERE